METADLVAEFVRLNSAKRTRPLTPQEGARWQELKASLLIVQRHTSPRIAVGGSAGWRGRAAATARPSGDPSR